MRLAADFTRRAERASAPFPKFVIHLSTL